MNCLLNIAASLFVMLYSCGTPQGNDSTQNSNDSSTTVVTPLAIDDNSIAENADSLVKEDELPVMQESTSAPIAETPLVPEKRADVNRPKSAVQNAAKVYIDKEGYTIKNGERIFPLGVFINSKNYTTPANLKQIAEGGFNTVLCYDFGTSASPATYLNNAAANNLNVIFSLKGMYPKSIKGNMQPFVDGARRLINRVKDHDALLAWYINDELDPSWIPLIAQIHKTVKENDNDHPTFQALYQEGVLGKYRDVTDILAMVSYNAGNADDLTQSSKRAKLTRKAMQNRGVWQIPQIYNHTVYNKGQYEAPTLDQMRNQAYQAIINGAKGLIFYSYSDLFREKNPKTQKVEAAYSQSRWEDAATMGKEIKSYEKVILNGKQANSLFKVSNNEGVEFLALNYSGGVYLFLANPFYQNRSITFSLPKGYKAENSIVNDGIKVAVNGNQLVFDISSAGSGVYKLTAL